MFICVRIRYAADQWSTCRYLDMSRLDGMMQSTDRSLQRQARPFPHKTLDQPKHT